MSTHPKASIAGLGMFLFALSKDKPWSIFPFTNTRCYEVFLIFPTSRGLVSATRLFGNAGTEPRQ